MVGATGVCAKPVRWRAAPAVRAAPVLIRLRRVMRCGFLGMCGLLGLVGSCITTFRHAEWRVSLCSSYSCAGAIVAAARPLGGQLPRGRSAPTPSLVCHFVLDAPLSLSMDRVRSVPMGPSIEHPRAKRMAACCHIPAYQLRSSILPRGHRLRLTIWFWPKRTQLNESQRKFSQSHRAPFDSAGTQPCLTLSLI